ncbi:hypothetical protein FIV42_03675 [Persicimonas caeni]|uniref:Peptidase C-terminal archaeal/bacterial domain-containing protein n=1 Tax=Persicimonas caeni TaxID=2292766 RepID=A0A4Y6PNP1_PERCE|nr:hypothetical protein [Persicimonas caeni]QDG49870.1 hypothetical protein FIV42_03675 [Persicimonas caeni]QED31091.1 hypothetical protein FRD00_03670 [Persicimonas caeni]
MEIRAMNRWALLCIALCLGAAGLSGCSDDDDTNNVTIDPNPDTSTPDTRQPDTGDVGEDVAEDVGDDATDTDDAGGDADTGEQVGDLCEVVNDLGLIEANGGATATGTTSGGTNLINPSCGSDDVREVVYQFSVDAPARVTAQVQSQDTDNWTLGLYSGDCDNPQRVKCEDVNADVFIAEPGVTYFLSVEPRDVEDASFSLSLSMTQIACAPMGSTECDGESVVRCESGFTEVTYSCAYACDSGACGADICDNAIEVTGAGSHNFTGSYTGYGNDFNFQNRDDCTSASVGVNTPGQDLVFYLPGLSQGQTLTIDAAADDFQEGIFVFEGACSQQAPCAAGNLVVNGILDWTVDADGDYYVVVDLLEQQTGNFDITITR